MRDYIFTQNVSARFPDLANKVAIVTGADGNIGSAIANFLGLQQMRLVLTSNSDQAAGNDFAAMLQDKGIRCVWVSADMAQAAGSSMVLHAALEKWGEIDVLVNNAAVLKSSPFILRDHDSYHQTFETNVRMVYTLSQCVVMHMLDQKRPGSVINISSVGGLRPHRNLVSYDMSKGAIDNLTRAMAMELGPHGIRVNAVAPGGVPHGQARDFDRVPLGRTGTGEEIAAAVAFFASDAASYITGQILYVDGGMTTQLSPPGINI